MNQADPTQHDRFHRFFIGREDAERGLNENVPAWLPPEADVPGAELGYFHFEL